MNWILTILLLFFSFEVGRWTVRPGKMWLLTEEIVTTNYQGKSLPTGFGGVLIFLFLLLSSVVAFFSFFFFYIATDLFLTVLFASISVCFLGWLDDTKGSHHAKGFRGHFRELFVHRRLTTGMIKAVGGGAVATIAATVTSVGFTEWVVHTLFIGLMTNWINLLDLRPGRSIKFYLAGTILLLLLPGGKSYALLFVPLLGLVLAVFRYDLNAKVMLGDSGSNLLGVHLALWTAVVSPLWLLTVLTLLLIFGHYYGETRSLSRLIEESRWLGLLDRWGRGES